MNRTHPPILLRDDAPIRSDASSKPAHPGRIVRAALASLFFLAENARWALDLLRPIAIALTVALRPSLARATGRNAEQISGRKLNGREKRCFARAVVRNFYDVVVDLGGCANATVKDLEARIESVDGHDRYLAIRARKRGAVLVTAHMGAFEVGLAALRQMEPSAHVLFKRDPFERFERIRSRVRALLGVHEAPIDDGWPALLRLRDALNNDEVVVVQADRAMRGQRSAIVPFCSGRLRIPVGPVKLAQLTGSPIVPVYLARLSDGRFRVHVDEPIEIDPGAPLVDGVDPALLAIARSLGSFIARYPEQWLVLENAFVEDQS